MRKQQSMCWQTLANIPAGISLSQALEAMARKRKQAVLTQRRLDATHEGAGKQPGGLNRLWSFVAGAAADAPEQSLATIELEVCCCDEIQSPSLCWHLPFLHCCPQAPHRGLLSPGRVSRASCTLPG